MGKLVLSAEAKVRIKDHPTCNVKVTYLSFEDNSSSFAYHACIFVQLRLSRGLVDGSSLALDATFQ